ncbi:uncharacterized protein LOC135959992 [Calliphora vicina]|uniref:uncharacterized protein LOC135959992 n=1 Tax=Calliphora vicina TaxID=7373 RepID=UPI00325BC948
MALNSTIINLLLASTASSAGQNINKLQQIPQLVNSSLIIDIVQGLHQRLEFQNFVFFISKHLFGELDFFHGFWQTLPFVPVTIIGDNNSSLKGLLSTPCLCFIMTTEWQDPIMELAALSLKSIRYFRTMFVLFPVEEYNQDEDDKFQLAEFNSLNENIRLLYEWAWQQQFLNTLLITINNNIYLYEPFPQGNVMNVTLDWSLEDFFRDQKLDLKGFEIITPLRFDLPRVFSLRRFPNKGRISKLSGSSGKLFGAFIEHINGTFNDQLIHEHEFEFFNMTTFIVMVESQQLEISVHSYTSMQTDEVSTSYPVGINDWCLMVPFRNSSAQHTILLDTLQLSTWLLLAFAAVYIMLGIWLCCPKQNRDLSLAFLQSICCLMQLPPLKLMTLPLKRLKYLFIVLFVVGFCLTNMYLSKMASYLTANRPQQQINTLQDIISANLSIMMLDFEYQLIMRMNYTSRFLDLILPVSPAKMDRHRQVFNTSFGYSVPSDIWNFLNRQQQYLKQPLFRLSSVCMGPFYHVFPLQTDSYLLKPLNDFIGDVRQTGFIYFWENEAFYDALFMGYVRMFKIDQEFKALSLEFFSAIIIIWFSGLLLALVMFVMEIRRVNLAKLSLRFKRRNV